MSKKNKRRKRLSPNSKMIKNALASKREGARIFGRFQMRFDEPERWLKNESVDIKKGPDSKKKECKSK
jgi:hypothetical protein